MKSKLRHLFSSKDIPEGVRVLTFATSVRWFGWGFAESLLPIFIFSFSQSFAEAALLRSIYDVGLIFALPLIGMAADRVRASTLLLISISMYVLIGTSYFLAGLTGLVIFIIIARLINGPAYALDLVGRSTYFRRHTSAKKIATVFGYFDTVADFWWVVAAVIGIVLIKYFSIGTLLFMIAPMAVLAFAVVWKFRKQDTELTKPVGADNPTDHISFIRLMSGWSWSLRSLVILNFFISCASAVVAFFLPIEAYTEGASLGLIILFGVVATIPTLFGWELGKWFDIKGEKAFVPCLIVFAILLLSIPFFDGYLWKLTVAFLSGLIVEFLSVGNNELVTIHANPKHFGQVEGVTRSLGYMGSLAGPLAIGIVMDSFGITSAYVTLAILLAALASVFYLLHRYGYLKRRRSV